MQRTRIKVEGGHISREKKKKKLYTWGAVERNLHTGQFSL